MRYLEADAPLFMGNPYRFSSKERTAADYDFGFINKERKDSKNMGNTYQFYYWITKL